jgi:hypothetical protein
MADNALTLAGCGDKEIEMTESEYAVVKKQVEEFEKKQASKTSKKRESSKDVKGAAMKAAHSTLKGLAEQHPEAADLLNAHADMYKDEKPEPKDGDGEEEAAVGDEATPDTTESEASKKKEKEKKEKMEKEKKESDEEESDKEESEKMESLRKELFDVKLENKLTESALPAPICKMIRNLSEGKTLEQMDEIIEAQSEVLELTLRESRGGSMPERTFAGIGKTGGSGLLANDPAFN